MKNICGKIPLELHEKVREEIELTESSTQLFIQMVIEEHFMKKGAMSMAEARTVAVQVSEELFGKLKAVLVRNKWKQKEFLISILERAIAADEEKWKQDNTELETIEAESDSQAKVDTETEE